MSHSAALLTIFSSFLLAAKWTYTQEHFLTLSYSRAVGSAAYDPSASHLLCLCISDSSGCYCNGWMFGHFQK